MRARATSRAVISSAALLADQDEFVVDRDRRAGHVGHVGHQRVHRDVPTSGTRTPRTRASARFERARAPAVGVADRQRRDPARPAGGEARTVADPAAGGQVGDPDRPGMERQDRTKPGRRPGPRRRRAGRQAAGRTGPGRSGPHRGSARCRPAGRRSPSGDDPGSGSRRPRAGRSPSRIVRPGWTYGPRRPAPGGATRSRPGGRPGRTRSGRRRPRRRRAGGRPGRGRSRARGGGRADGVDGAGRSRATRRGPARGRPGSAPG